MELIFVFSERTKKKKMKRQEAGDYRNACKPGGRTFGMEINFRTFFNYTKAMKLNSGYENFFFTVISFRFFPLSAQRLWLGKIEKLKS